MDALLAFIKGVCSRIQAISDLFWEFPTNLKFYADIPVLGEFSLALFLLLGSGVYFTIRLRFIQIRRFGYALSLLAHKRAGRTGLSPLAAFFLSTAMRVGPGNIIGVTGAISVGGPGALFWMWVSAFFGMATAFVESTLAQIFKERKGGEYIGGMAFYGRRLAGDSVIVGVALSLVYIVYALLCFPAQGFNSVSSLGMIASLASGETLPTTHWVYWLGFALVLGAVAAVSFGGTKKIAKVTGLLVPLMACVYVALALALIVANAERLGWFFEAVFVGAFAPEAAFGGALGTVIMQGVRRGLMSNEAGQGTLTMPAATADAAHPCDQGCVQAVGVFLDTIVLATLTGFVVIMAHAWSGGEAWAQLGKLQKFLVSVEALSPASNLSGFLTFVSALCFGLFAFTTLLGFMSFSEICANRISRKAGFINSVRVLNIAVIAFGMLTSIVGMDLGALWDLSDFANVLIAFCNIPLLFLGFGYVLRATKHFESGGAKFDESVVGVKLDAWKAAK